MRATAPPLLGDAAAALLPWVAAGSLGAAEVHGAEVLLRDEPDAPLAVRLAAAFALWAPLHGHVCFDLARAAELVSASRATESVDDELLPLPWPALDPWRAAVAGSRLVRTVARSEDDPPLDDRPLVLMGTRLYAQRQWVDECVVAVRLRALAQRPARAPGPAVETILASLWPATGDTADDAQRAAASIALGGSVAAIVGGPGSGKTYTVAGLLAAALADDSSTRIALAAPTGKAAQRLRDSIAATVRDAQTRGILGPELARELTRCEPTTLHRLLGPLPTVRTRFRHDATNPLPHDLVVVDEMSMVALPMMARLLEAIRPDARLVLIGDPDQLESIEAGSVLADIVSAADAGAVLHGHVARLGRSRRQKEGSPITALAEAIRTGDADAVLALLRSGRDGLDVVDVEDPLSARAIADVRAVVLPALTAVRAAARSDRARAALDAMATVRVLCAHRRGRAGADEWNDVLTSWVLDGQPRRRHFAGRALLVTRNDLRNGLANGDSGVMVAGGDGLVAAFDVGGELRTFGPAQLADVETAFATTVHKSQGSEHDTVVFVVPPEGSPLARRELLYTAVTRARRRLVVVGDVNVVAAAVRTPSTRATGLVDALTNTSPASC